MIGAMVTTGLFALASTLLATLGNFAIAREFPDLRLDRDADVFADPLFDPGLEARYAQYRLTANLFHRQSLVLWALLALMAAYNVFVRFF